MTTAYDDLSVDLSAEPVNILFLDDDALLCRAFERLAAREGLKVTCFSQPEKALEAIAQETFHIIAIDFRMPGMTGVHFLEQQRERLKDTYKIMVTGMCDFETVHAAINRAGVQRYVTKPWQNEEFVSIIRDGVRHARLVMENKELHRRLKTRNQDLAVINQNLGAIARSRTLDVLNALIAALDYRDTETQWHSRRVALFARMIAAQMGYSGIDLYDIEIGAMLHDIGKIGISDTILLKSGKLTEDEWREMRKHPELGYHLLANIEFLERARKIVRQHHERWDGGGYPQGLQGEEIVPGARIFALCDTLDAITSDRPYRKARDFSVAREEIIRCAGTQFDPEVVGAFLSVPEIYWRRVLEFGHAREDDPVAHSRHWRLSDVISDIPGLNDSYSLLSVMRHDQAEKQALNIIDVWSQRLQHIDA